MPRSARVVMPDYPHHVTQRGNRRQPTFFGDEDYWHYVKLMVECCVDAQVRIWAWCLMPNHVHLVMQPATADGLRRALARAHQRYTFAINRRKEWSGYLWQGRFSSVVMDEAHTLIAMRYIEQNPVRAGLCERPENWPWSSARVHLGLGLDPLTDLTATRGMVADWQDFLSHLPRDEASRELREHTQSGRPLGSPEFISKIEKFLGRSLPPGKRGRPVKSDSSKR